MKSLSKLYSQFKDLQKNGLNSPVPRVSDLEKTTCLNCGTEFQGRYCPVCGQGADTRRINIKGLFTGLFTALVGGDSTFSNTAIELMYRPGYLIRDYICGKRARYYKPVPLLLFLVTLYVLLSFAIDSSYSPFSILSDPAIQQNIHSDSLSAAVAYLAGLLSNKVTFALTASFLCVLPFDLVFKGRKIQRPDGTSDRLQAAEHFYALVYICCLYIILSFVMLLFSGIPAVESFLRAASIILPILLAIWTYRQIYGIGWIRSTVYTTAVVVITLLALSAITILVFGLFYGFDAASA